MRLLRVQAERRKASKRAWYTPMATLSLFWASAGCVSLNTADYGLVVSQDAAFAAHIRSKYAVFGLACRGVELGGKRFVRLCRLDHPWNLASIKIDEYDGASPSGYIGGMSPVLKFSPDSRRLAVLTRGALSCIDLDTSRMWPLAPSDDRVTTFSWIGPDEIAYVGHPGERVFLRCKIDAPPGTREVIHDGAGPAIQGTYFPFEYWSPRGRFVVYKRSDSGFALLEVHTGVVRSFDAPPAAAMEVAWKADESAVLCVSYDEIHSPKAAVLIDLKTGKSLDLSEQFVDAFTDGFGTELDPAWTPDGKYFIVNTVSRGGLIVQPEPWKVIPIGERLVDDLGGRFRPDLFSDPSQNPPPSVHAFPVAGWIKVFAGGKDYAVDYAVQNFVQLGGGARQSGYPTTVASPKGDRVAQITLFGNTKVRNIDLAAAKRLQHRVPFAYR